MERVEYGHTQAMIFEAARIGLMMTEALDLDSFIRDAERVDTIAPIFNPSAWMAGHERVHAVLDLARATRTYRAAILRVREELTRTEPRAAAYREEIRQAREALGI